MTDIPNHLTMQQQRSPEVLETAEQHAKRCLPQPIFDYFAGAAGDERTLQANLDAFQEIKFRPRCLIPVKNVSTTTTIPGLGELSAPILIAPMAMQCMAHPDGEKAIAKVASSLALPFILSTFSTTSYQKIADIHPCPLLQLYLFEDRQISLSLVNRATNRGFRAVVLTVDAPHFGRRERDKKSEFRLPENLHLANFETTDIPKPKPGMTELDALGSAIDAELDESKLKALVNDVDVPVWVKGVLRGDDAAICVAAGATGIVVSNHGARQLEGTIPSMHALPEIVESVGADVPVLVDSGVRSGEDVLRALCMGAKAVLVGRPLIWALAEGGEDTVRLFLEEMCSALRLAMMLTGAPSVHQITRDLVVVQRK